MTDLQRKIAAEAAKRGAPKPSGGATDGEKFWCVVVPIYGFVLAVDALYRGKRERARTLARLSGIGLLFNVIVAIVGLTVVYGAPTGQPSDIWPPPRQ